jgi:hypothetical protein
VAVNLEIGCGAFALGWAALECWAYRIRCERDVVSVLIVGWALVCVAASLGGLPTVAVALAIGVGFGAALATSVGSVTFLVVLLLVRPWEMPGLEPVFGLTPRLFAGIAITRVVLDGLLGTVTDDERPVGIHRGVETLLFVVLFGWFFVAAGLAEGSEGLAQVDFAGLLPLGVVFILVPSVCTSEPALRLVKSGVVVAVLGAIGAAFFHLPSQASDPASMSARLTGSGLFGNSNDLAALIAIALPLLVIGHGSRGRPWGNVVVWFGSTVLLAGLWLAQSRGAIIALVVGGCTYFLLRGKQRWRLVIGLLVVAGAAAFFFQSVTRDAADLEGSRSSRWNYIIAGFRMVRSAPVAGVGMGNYPRMYERFTPAFDEWGERTAHSSWVLALAEGGIPGFALFTLFACAVGRRAWRSRHDAPEWLIAAVTYGVTMSFLSHTYSLLPYLLAACVIGAGRVHAPIARAVDPLRTPMPSRRTPPWCCGRGRARGRAAVAER